MITLEQLVASGPLKVVWLVEHQDNRIWKQFPESLAYLVEQAHILNIKKIHTNRHIHTRKIRPTRNGCRIRRRTR